MPEYSRKNNITLQHKWSHINMECLKVFIDNLGFPELNAMMDEIAKKYGVTKNAIATA